MRKKKRAKRKQKPRKDVHDHHLERCAFIVVLILAYLALATHKHGMEDGVGITVLTWAFFVLLTPVPSADLVLEIPLRFFTNHRMVFTHVAVWGLGIVLVVSAALVAPELFQTTTLLSVLYHVLTNPFPYWGLLFLCGLGTFLSVHIVDEVMDGIEHELKHHHRKHMPAAQMAILGIVLISILLAYNSIITQLNIAGELSLF